MEIEIEIKENMLSKYQLLIADFHNIPVGNVKKLVYKSFDTEKYVLHQENLQLYLRRGLKLKKHHVLDFNQSQWLRPYIDFNKQKRTEAGKNGYKDEKVLHKLINNHIYGKTMENVRNIINAKLVNGGKYYLKCT